MNTLTATNYTQIANAVAVVFGALTDYGAEEFERIALDNGILKRCQACGWNVDIDQTHCEECGSSEF